MDELIKKRVDLINFFLNENTEYTKEEVLNKEFAVLTFSPHEEYIDYIKTDYDDLCVDLNTYDPNDGDEEIYVKGIIIDVDNKKDYTILHLQNKGNNISVSCNKALVYHYSEFFNVGEPVIMKCHTFSGKFYGHFLVALNDIEYFYNEQAYMTGESYKKMDNYNSNLGLFALVCQCTYFISSNGNPCIRLLLYTSDQSFGMYISCKNPYNVLPANLKAGDFIEFKKSNKKPYIQNVIKVRI